MQFHARRTEGIEFEELEAELMIMDRQSDRVHVFNSTMAAVWKLCDGTRSEDAIAHELTEFFDCSSADDLMGSIHEALRVLDGLGLLCRAGENAGLE